MIEEAHDAATRVLREHMDELHNLSLILIERETVDKDQFERLLAGDPEGIGLPGGSHARPPPLPEVVPEKKPVLRPTPRTIPGAAMQPPPEGAAS